MKQEIEAKLLLGLDASPRKYAHGPSMAWDDFRDEYSRLKLVTMRDDTASSNENRLDVCQRIIKPRSLSDMTKPAAMERLKPGLLVGRSPHTVNSYLSTLVAALNWAHAQEWIPKRISKQEVPADDPEKGRPLTEAEFDQMLEACDIACPKDPASWKYLLRGLWESSLRVNEAMNLSWDTPGTIQIIELKSGRLAMKIPGKRQKNRKAQILPVTPMFEELLDKHAKRTGWVFNPSMRNGRAGRPKSKAVSKAISAIGEQAGIIVSDEGKFASAHDLRRSFGQRMADRGISPRDLQKLMRHSSFTTTEAYYLADQVDDMSDRLSEKLYPGTFGNQRSKPRKAK